MDKRSVLLLLTCCVLVCTLLYCARTRPRQDSLLEGAIAARAPRATETAAADLATLREQLEDPKRRQQLQLDACQRYVAGDVAQMPAAAAAAHDPYVEQKWTEAMRAWSAPPRHVRNRQATTWPPIKGAACELVGAGPGATVVVRCADEGDAHFARDGFEHARDKCVGPWEEDPTSGAPVSACARNADGRPYYEGDHCENETLLSKLRKGSKDRGVCSRNASVNVYAHYLEHFHGLVVPHKFTTLPRCSESSPHPACKTFDEDGIGYYGPNCEHSFQPSAEVLNHCLPYRATGTIPAPPGCAAAGKFVVDTETGRISVKPGFYATMNEACECLPGRYRLSGSPAACEGVANKRMRIDKRGHLVGCVDTAYGAACEHSLQGLQRLRPGASQLDAAGVECPVPGLAWNLQRSADGSTTGCAPYVCDPKSGHVGRDCDARCPPGSVVITDKVTGETRGCLCDDAGSRDHQTVQSGSEKGSSGAPDAWCSAPSRCGPGRVAPSSPLEGVGCVKCPGNSVPNTTRTACECPHGSLGAPHFKDAGRLLPARAVATQTEFCSACVDGFETSSDGAACSACSGVVVRDAKRGTVSCAPLAGVSPYLALSPQEAHSRNFITGSKGTCALFDYSVTSDEKGIDKYGAQVSSEEAAARCKGDQGAGHVPTARCLDGFGPWPRPLRCGEHDDPNDTTCAFRTVQTAHPPPPRNTMLLVCCADGDSDWRPLIAPASDWCDADSPSAVVAGRSYANVDGATLLRLRDPLTWDALLFMGSMYPCVFHQAPRPARLPGATTDCSPAFSHNSLSVSTLPVGRGRSRRGFVEIGARTQVKPSDPVPERAGVALPLHHSGAPDDLLPALLRVHESCRGAHSPTAQLQKNAAACRPDVQVQSCSVFQDASGNLRLGMMVASRLHIASTTTSAAAQERRIVVVNVPTGSEQSATNWISCEPRTYHATPIFMRPTEYTSFENVQSVPAGALRIGWCNLSVDLDSSARDGAQALRSLPSVRFAAAQPTNRAAPSVSRRVVSHRTLCASQCDSGWAASAALAARTSAGDYLYNAVEFDISGAGRPAVAFRGDDGSGTSDAPSMIVRHTDAKTPRTLVEASLGTTPESLVAEDAAICYRDVPPAARAR